MIYAFLDLLKTNINFPDVLKDKQGNIKVYPNYTNVAAPYVVYTNFPETYGSVRTNRLELKIVSEDYDQLEALSETILKILILGDAPAAYTHENVIIKQIELSGSGTLPYDDINKIERILTLNVKWRDNK